MMRTLISLALFALTLVAPWMAAAECESVIGPFEDLEAELQRGKLLAAEPLKPDQADSNQLDDRFKYFLLIDGRLPTDEKGFKTYLTVMSEMSGKPVKQLREELKKTTKISSYLIKSLFLSTSILSGQPLEEVKKTFLSAKKSREDWINASLTAIAVVSGNPLTEIEEQYDALKKIKDSEARILLISTAAFTGPSLKGSLNEAIAKFNQIKIPKLEEDKARLILLATLSNQPIDLAVKHYKKVFKKSQNENNLIKMLSGRDGDATVELATQLFGKRTKSIAQYAKLEDMPMTFTITGDVAALGSLLGFDDGEGEDPLAKYTHPNGRVYYRNGEPYGGRVYYDRDGRAYDSRPTLGDTLINRLRGR